MHLSHENSEETGRVYDCPATTSQSGTSAGTPLVGIEK